MNEMESIIPCMLRFVLVFEGVVQSSCCPRAKISTRFSRVFVIGMADAWGYVQAFLSLPHLSGHRPARILKATRLRST